MNIHNDLDGMRLALQWAEKGLYTTSPNPHIGCVIVRDGVVIGAGVTQPAGQDHAEIQALKDAAQRGHDVRGATAYVTLEPCAHYGRTPPCCDALVSAGLGRVVCAMEDPNPLVAGQGMARLAAAGIEVSSGLLADEAYELNIGFFARMRRQLPWVRLKTAASLDGMTALENGESQWITGPEARAHCHAERARADAILVGGGTLRADNPRLDVRLPGLEGRSPQRWVLTRRPAPAGWHALPDPASIQTMQGVQYLFVEGGAETAAAFLRAELVDDLLLYRAPILIGGGKPGIADLGLTTLADAHGQWQRTDFRQLGNDTVERYERC